MSLQLRDLSGLAEFRAAQALQTVVWGQDDQPDPADLMMVVQAEGGIAAGAFDGDLLVGYVFGFPTRDPAIQHSHRLAVLPDYRGHGTGAALKLYQRDWCRARGIAVLRWTYDPLQVRNANLNINRLGAIGSSYLVNYYGSEGSYQASVETDRVIAELQVDQRPDTRAEAWLPVPGDFAQLLQENTGAAHAARASCREDMQALFAQGLVIVGFDPVASVYAFGRVLR